MNIIEKIKILVDAGIPAVDEYRNAFLSSGTYSGFQLSQVINLSSGSFPPYYLDHPYYPKDQSNLPRMDYAAELVLGGEILVCEYCGTRYLFDKSKVTDAIRKIECIECGGSLV